MKEDLTIGAIIRTALQDGVKNILPIAVNYVLWVLTIWIPYINIGTTIGLSVGLVAKAGRGEAISYTEIFNPQYRKQMGNYFLTEGLKLVGIMIGLLLFIVPGIVLAVAWMLGTLIAVDQGENPLTALVRSNEATYGKKVVIFVALLIIQVIISVALYILSELFGSFNEGLALVIVLLGSAATASFFISAVGFIYHSIDPAAADAKA